MHVFIDQLMKYRLDKWTVRWTENWLNLPVLGAVINDTKSSWNLLHTPGVAESCANSFISNLDNGTPCALDNFAADTTYGCAAI